MWAPYENKNGIKNNIAQNAEIFPKLCSQKCGFTSGNTAMDNNIPANGNTENKGNCPNSDPLAKRLENKIPINIDIL